MENEIYLSGDFYFYFYLTLYFWRFENLQKHFHFRIFWFLISFFGEISPVKKTGLQLVVREVKGRNTVKGNEKTQASRKRTCELVSTCRVCPTQRGKKDKGKNQIANFSSTCRERQAGGDR
jgi:hypothetical protein